MATPTSIGGFESNRATPIDDAIMSATSGGVTPEVEEKPILVGPDDMLYFQERYPGKICVLCNLGERSQLGQGEMMRFEFGLISSAGTWLWQSRF